LLPPGDDTPWFEYNGQALQWWDISTVCLSSDVHKQLRLLESSANLKKRLTVAKAT
jgi:hypothetical protein